MQHWRRSTVIMLAWMRFFTCYCPIFGSDGQRISRALVSSVGEQKVCGGKARRVHISLERRRASWSAAPLGKMERSLPSVTAPRNADELGFWSACSTKFMPYDCWLRPVDSYLRGKRGLQKKFSPRQKHDRCWLRAVGVQTMLGLGMQTTLYTSPATDWC